MRPEHSRSALPEQFLGMIVFKNINIFREIALSERFLETSVFKNTNVFREAELQSKLNQ